MRPAWQPDAWPGRCARAPPRPAVPFLPTASSNGVCSRREPGQVSAAVKLFPILSFPENLKEGRGGRRCAERLTGQEMSLD